MNLRGSRFVLFPFISSLLSCASQGSCDSYLLCFIVQGRETAQVNSSTAKFYMNIIFLNALAYWRKSLQIDTNIGFSVIKNLRTEGKTSVSQVIPKTLETASHLELCI